jgi:4-alpha-glucanotransferase
MNDLTETAQNWGIDLHYYDVFGKRHEASPETLTRLIDAISASGATPHPADLVQGAPLRAYQGDVRRLWALGLQLYAVRSGRNWGHGDFTDLKRLIAIAAAHGASGIGLNPLHT